MRSYHKKPFKLIYLFLMIGLFIPIISAAWYNPFTWFTNEEIIGTELITKPQGEIVSNANGLNVDWKHLSDQTNPKQTFLLTVTSNSSRTVDPQLILSEYSGNTNNLNVKNINITYLEKSVSYEYKTKWCSDYTYTNCQYEQTDYYYINGGFGQVLIETTREVAMPLSESQFKRTTGIYKDKTEDILTIDINDLVLETNKSKTYIISIDGIEPKYIGKTRVFSGTFSLMIDGLEYWDKTHSSYWTSTDNCTSSGGTIDTYILNDTTNFNIDAVTGLIKNTTRLNSIEKYWLEITVNNSVGNSTTGIFYINVVSGTICRYEKFGVYNIKIPFLKEVNCNRKFGVNNNE